MTEYDGGASAARFSEFLRRQPAPLPEVLEFFDSLPAVAVEEMDGAWAGGELATGNPMDGMLGLMGWHGKRFDGPDGAHPLVMDDGHGGRFQVDPKFLPMGSVGALLPIVRRPLAAAATRRAMGAMRTSKPRARLREVAYRGVPTATMIYDALPINDHFRRVDADTLLGVMDLRGLPAPYVFYLRREAGVGA